VRVVTAYNHSSEFTEMMSCAPCPGGSLALFALARRALAAS
jgi:hypothetical protein